MDSEAIVVYFLNKILISEIICKKYNFIMFFGLQNAIKQVILIIKDIKRLLLAKKVGFLSMQEKKASEFLSHLLVTKCA